MALVLGLTVFVDLITAVGAGVVLAALAYVKQVAKIQLDELQSRPLSQTSPEEQSMLDELGNQITMFEFNGPLSFGAAADVGHHVRERYKDATRSILLDFQRVPFIDVSAARAVETIAGDAEKAGKQVLICGMSEGVKDTLVSLGADDAIPNEAYFETRKLALESLVQRSENSGAPKLHPRAVSAVAV
ncbi:MAG: STAS domain-containing protein [Pseudomonadota bacterium]